MARTYHHHNRAACARFWNKENKAARKSTTRALRRANTAISVALVLEHVDAEGVTLPVFRGTCGRLTW